MMKRCPTCGSRKWHGFKGRWKCGNCGKIWISSAVQETNNDKGLINHIKPSLIPQNSVDLHNIALKFKITKDSKVDWPKQEGFRGFIQLTTFKGYKIKKTKNWLIIYNDKRNKVKLSDLEKTYSVIEKTLINLAIEISQCYNFEIEPTPLSFSRNRPEVKTEFLASNNFHETEAKAVYPNPSPIEFTGKNSINNSMNLTMMLSELRDSIMLEIENKKKHDKVLESMLETNKEMRDTLKELKPKKINPLLKPLENLLDTTIKIAGVIDTLSTQRLKT